MKPHRYLRAYMAGIVFPTIFIVLGLAVFTLERYAFEIPIPTERVIIFPMALGPTLFGLWNMLYTRLSRGRYLSIGLHGAILPVLFVPIGMAGAIAGHFLHFSSEGAVWFDAITLPYILLVPWFAIVMIVYYLIWKYLVGFLNQVLEIAWR
jgi:hypothetical protein